MQNLKALRYIFYYHSEYLKHERKFVEHQMALSGCGEKCPVQRKMRRVAGI